MKGKYIICTYYWTDVDCFGGKFVCTQVIGGWIGVDVEVCDVEQ